MRSAVPENFMPGLSRILKLPGIQYLATRFGNVRLRQWAFDEKFRSGEWNFKPSNELAEVIDRYAEGGSILMLGCGSGSLVEGLNPTRYSKLIGVDLSDEAIRRANRNSGPGIQFIVGDMTRFSSAERFKVILLSESLYYVSWWRRRAFLSRLLELLERDGRIVITIAQPYRFARLIRMIRRNFHVLEDKAFQNSSRRLLVLTRGN